MKLPKKKTPPPPERRFNLARPGDEMLFQGTEMELDEIPLRTRVLLTPCPWWPPNRPLKASRPPSGITGKSRTKASRNSGTSAPRQA
jgi:hypothetical protein